MGVSSCGVGALLPTQRAGDQLRFLDRATGTFLFKLWSVGCSSFCRDCTGSVCEKTFSKKIT